MHGHFGASVVRRARPRTRLFSALVVLSLLAIDEAPPAAQTPGSVLPGVADKVAEQGRLEVIVGLRYAVPSLTRGVGAPLVRQKQAELRAALDPFIGQAAAAGVRVGLRYPLLPFFTAVVDGPSLQWLSQQPEVEFVQESHRLRPSLAVSVPLIRAPEAWAAGATGAGWYVGVVDTGIAPGHPFLQGKLSVRQMCISTGAIRDDDPDAPIIGFTLCPGGANVSFEPGSGVACGLAGCEHGTHVAGIVAGGTIAGGVSGVAPGATLISAQVFRRGTSLQTCGDDPIPCIFTNEGDYLYALSTMVQWSFIDLDDRVAAVNLSLGWDHTHATIAECDTHHPAARSTLTQARLAEVAPVVASGNGGALAGISPPACVTGAIRVGSTTKQDVISMFTNRASFLSLLAPGENIISSVPGGSYAAMSGTSQAAPHVAGAWAVLKHAKPDATTNQVLQALRTTGVQIPDPFAIPAAAYPRIDVEAARRALLGVGPAAPAPPVNVAAAVNGSVATVTWAPGVGGGVPTHFLVVAGTTPAGSQLGVFNVGPATSASGTLAAGIYYARIIAVNAAGQSAPSAEVTITVGGALAPPGPPSGLAAVVNGQTVALSWQAPSSGGAVAGYRIEASLVTGGSPIAVLPVTGVALTVTDVPPGIYYVRVVATNAAGTSVASNEAVVAVAVTPPPGAPGALVSTVTAGSVLLSWSAPATGGAPTAYRIQAGSAPGLSNLADVLTGSAATGFSAQSVPAGLYFVRVRAVNGAGVGAPSNESPIVVGGASCNGPLAVALTWNTGSTTGTPTFVDLDLHGFEPDGTHVSYSDPVGPTLRLLNDNATGLGPEIMCVTQSQSAGTYEIAIAAFSGNQWPTTATITVSADHAGQVRTFTRTLGSADGLVQRIAAVTGSTITELTGTREVIALAVKTARPFSRLPE